MLQRRELSWTRCLELLNDRGVCRVAVSSPDGPHVYPANYTLHDEAVWFRLPLHSAVASLIGSRAAIALEVDRINEENPAGWVVVVRGQASAVRDDDLVSRVLDAWSPRPWEIPGHFVYLRLPLEEVTGREVGPANTADWTGDDLARREASST